jgi:hypothetical protein
MKRSRKNQELILFLLINVWVNGRGGVCREVLRSKRGSKFTLRREELCIFTVCKSKWDVLVCDSEENLKEFMFVILIIKVFSKYS